MRAHSESCCERSVVPPALESQSQRHCPSTQDSRPSLRMTELENRSQRTESEIWRFTDASSRFSAHVIKSLIIIDYLYGKTAEDTFHHCAVRAPRRQSRDGGGWASHAG